MRIHRVLENILFKLISPPGAEADGVVPTTWIDISTYERFGFMQFVGATDDTGVTMQVRQATSAGGANAKDVTGAAITGTVLAGTNDNKWAGVEVETRKLDLNGGDFRYVAVNIAATGGAATQAAIVFFAFPPQIAPVEQGADCAELVYVDG